MESTAYVINKEWYAKKFLAMKGWISASDLKDY
jgi:hypothetical protein